MAVVAENPFLTDENDAKLMMVKQEAVDVYDDYSGLARNEPLVEKVKRIYNRKPKSESTVPKIKRVKKEPVENDPSQTRIEDHMAVQKRKRDRFKGTTEEEVLTRVLPDHIKPDLDILIVGINPGLTAAYVQHHYAGPGNHFWKCLLLSGMIPKPMNALQDAELLDYGIGFTNIVARTTRGSADLTRKEIAEGGEILKDKMLKFLPKIAVFNGKGIYEVFCGSKNFDFGLQPEPFPGCPQTCVFVNPSSSARCTQLPRAVDKVPFYEALKRVRDYIRQHGSVEGIDRSTVTFPDFKLVTAPQKNKPVKEEIVDFFDEAIPPQSDDNKNIPKPKKAPTKPRKPRVAKVKDELKQTDQCNKEVTSQSPTNKPSQTQNVNDLLSSVNNKPINHHQNQSGLTDFVIKQEVIDPSIADTDLAAAIRQNLTAQQDVYQLQQVMQSGFLHKPNSVPHTYFMHASNPMSLKQEKADWSSYGILPNCAPASTLAAYQQYPCFWGYLPCQSNGMFNINPYSGIPNSHINNQQVGVSINSTVQQPTISMVYSSPQEASSPAMSSQSTLTQASLDSLPKADSASTIANWLQNIPNMSMAQ